MNDDLEEFFEGLASLKLEDAMPPTYKREVKDSVLSAEQAKRIKELSDDGFSIGYIADLLRIDKNVVIYAQSKK